MKNIILSMILLIVTTGVNVYAATDSLSELSFGLSGPGAGFTFLRGGQIEYLYINNEGLLRDYGVVSFAPMIQFDIVIEYLYFFAIETGVGYTKSSLAYNGEQTRVNGRIQYTEARFTREEITIPLMFRGQLDFYSIITYTSIGVKFGIPLSKKYYTYYVNGREQDLGNLENNGSDFTLDVAFAVGMEGLVGQSSYLGLRLGYDLSIINPGDPRKMAAIFGGRALGFESAAFSHDNLNFSLTYRYMFGR